MLIGLARCVTWARCWGRRDTVDLPICRDEELRGLDICEHGMESYNGPQVFSNV